MQRTFVLLLGTVAVCGFSTWSVSEARGEITYTTADCPGAAETRINGINDSGAFVGEYRLPGGFGFGGFVYDGSSWLPLDDPNGPIHWLSADGINNAGVIAGWYEEGSWPPAELPSVIAPPYGPDDRTLIPGPPDAFGEVGASGVSNSGLVAGGYATEPEPDPNFPISDRRVGEFRGYLYDGDDPNDPSNYSTFYHDDPGARWTEGWDVNDSRLIVGDYVNPDDANTYPYKHHGFLYDFDADQWTTLDYPGADSTEARGINESGQIVGFYREAGGRERGFLYQDGNWTTIDHPDANDTWAEGISDSGIIVGSYTDAAGVYHGFLTPEPATVMLLAAGFAGAWLGRRRHR